MFSTTLWVPASSAKAEENPAVLLMIRNNLKASFYLRLIN